MLEDLTDKSIFAATNERITAEPKDTTNVVVFGNDDGSRRTVISFDKSVFDGKNSIKLFDSKDQDIMSFFIKETMTKPPPNVHALRTNMVLNNVLSLL